jgi:hypothetical protein
MKKFTFVVQRLTITALCIGLIAGVWVVLCNYLSTY